MVNDGTVFRASISAIGTCEYASIDAAVMRNYPKGDHVKKVRKGVLTYHVDSYLEGEGAKGYLHATMKYFKTGSIGDGKNLQVMVSGESLEVCKSFLGILTHDAQIRDITETFISQT